MLDKTKITLNFIKEYYAKNPWAKYAVIGISGGKDSSVVAGLCVKALGKDNVFGVIMPNGEMSDLTEAEKLCNFLGIKHIVVNIKDANDAIINAINGSLEKENLALNRQGKINISPRLRMSTLYAIANSINGLVVNTSNYSEKILGYCTKWGDNVGDLAPIIHLTMQEVIQVGVDLGLPKELIEKVPSDGISGFTDEQNFGFSYGDLEKYINEQEIDLALKAKIKNTIDKNAHKSMPIPNIER